MLCNALYMQICVLLGFQAVKVASAKDILKYLLPEHAMFAVVNSIKVARWFLEVSILFHSFDLS